MPNTSYTYWYVLQYISVCIGMHYVGIWYVWNNDTCQYWPNTCLFFNTCQYWRQYIPKLNTRHYMPNTYQYIPIHTTICQIHTKTTSRLVQHTGFRPAYKYWHVSWYVLVCIMQVFGVYYVMILVKLAILTIFPIHTNTSICSKTCNTYHTYQCVPIQVSTHNLSLKYIQIQTNTDKYLPILTIHIITYQYRPVHQYIPYIQYRSIHTNTYHYIHYVQYIQILSNTGQYSQIHTHTDKYWQIPTNTCNTFHYLPIPTNAGQYIPYIPIQANTFNTGQYRWICINTIQYIPICTLHTIFSCMPILTNTYEYLHIWPLNTYRAEVRRSFITTTVRDPGHTTKAPQVGFELETNGFQFYVIANLDKTSPNNTYQYMQ